jgi:hypothetical protein
MGTIMGILTNSTKRGEEGVISFSSSILSALDICVASPISTAVTFYHLGPDPLPSTGDLVYSDVGVSIPLPNGNYSDGTNWYKVLNGVCNRNLNC